MCGRAAAVHCGGVSTLSARRDATTTPALLGVLALLRTAGWLYAAAWVVAAAAPPGHPLRAAGEALLAPLGPLLLTAGLRHLLARSGRALDVIPFLAVAVAGVAAVVAGHAAGVTPPVLAAAALAGVAAAARMLSRDASATAPDPCARAYPERAG